MPPAPPQTVLIVGAGEFGASAALTLARGPYKTHPHLITVLERGAEPPAVDAASSDYNKIVRADYADPLYQQLALDALEQWRTPRWSPHFHECGVVVATDANHPQADYVTKSYDLNCKSQEATVNKLEKGRGIKSLYPSEVETNDFEGAIAYRNQVGGWAASRDAVVATIDLARSLGVNFLTGEAETLLFRSTDPQQPDVRGVLTTDGRYFEADVTILACGSWTPKLLPELKEACLPTGQTVATVQLSKDEVEQYKDMPVSLFMDTGFYCFPPNKDGIVKLAIHDRGWLSPTGPFPSLPRTILTAGYEKQQIPAAALQALREGMARVHPALAKKEIVETRLCWYSDRESGDFLFDWHPRYPSLFVAAGGSGHAFKFMPLLGDWIVSSLERRLPSPLDKLWSFYGDQTRLDKSRGVGPIIRRDLDSGEIAQAKKPEAEKKWPAKL
ncbi:hypothetical protein JCM10908_006947 [Rhodotorula pacifica]|uniref:NAD(P)/FAD-dependent oxidoreductase n=1 Tax=Rhodotorula pacifica TaxID=1495444 RepID=UPI003175C4D9